MKHLPILLLISGIAFAILTRFVLPFEHVFTPGGIQLNTPDAYIMVRYADMLPYSIQWDWYSNWPTGQQPFHYLVFSFLIWISAKIMQVSTLTAGAVLPPVIFLLALVPVYYTARMLFDRTIAAGSVFALCLLPGEILQRTMLGAADYHCWEVLLLCSILACAIAAIQRHSWFMVFATAAISAIYLFSWQGAPIILLILALACLIALFLKLDYIGRSAMTFGLVAIIGLCCNIAPVYLPYLHSNFLGLFSINLLRPTVEAQSFLFTSGQFDLSVMLTYFGLTFWIALIGIGWLIYRVIARCDNADILFLSWSLVTLAMMIAQRRFDYYFAVNGAILAAFVVVAVIRYIGSSQAIRAAVVVALVLCLPLVKQSVMTSMSDTGYMPADWQKAVVWLQAESNSKAYYAGERPKYGILSCPYWHNGCCW